MPLWVLLYMARQYEDYVNESREDIYSSKLIQLPTPRCVVFYNGKKELPENAVCQAVNRGIEEKLLPDILLKQKGEVYSMLLTEYDEKRHMKNLYEAGKKDGIEKGIQQGKQQGIQRGIGALIEVCQELGMSQEEAVLRVVEEFPISEEKARQYVEMYWKILYCRK